MGTTFHHFRWNTEVWLEMAANILSLTTRKTPPKETKPKRRTNKEGNGTAENWEQTEIKDTNGKN